MWNQDQVLATDMFLVMCMGLRYHDLLKVRLQAANGEYFKTIRLIEKKNKHRSVRYLPTSLVEMAVASKASFPLSEHRLRKAVRTCLHLFKSAYGFKHHILTLLLAQLHRASSFAQMHTQSSTTARYYLNKDEEILVDSIFQLRLRFQWDEEVKTQIYNRSWELDLTGVEKEVKI